MLIDFGSNVFDGNARWLEVAVRSPAGGGSFTTLSPRQPLTAEPYSLQTRGVFVDNGGRVGIGTAAPSKRLDVNGGLGVFDGAGQGIALDSDSFSIASASTEDFAYQYSYPDDSHTFSTAGAARLVIDKFGRVGVGITSPQKQFQVGNTLYVAPLDSFVGINRSYPFSGEFFGVHAVGVGGVLAGMYVSMDDAGGKPFYGYAAGAHGMWTSFDGATDKWHVYNNGNRLTVDSSGNVGIGTTTPLCPLDVEASNPIQAAINAHTNSGMAVYGTSDGGIGVKGIGFNFGVVGVSSSSDGSAIVGAEVAGTGTTYAVTGNCSSPSGYDFYASGSGINYGAPSSIRWKRNIELVDSPLEKVEAMRGVTFDWDAAHGGHHDVGMIGEEVGKVLPEVVAYEADGQYVTGMDYSKLTPLLVEAVKALRAEKDEQLDKQQQQLDSLKSENTELRKQLKTLENQVRLLAEQRGAR